MNIYDFTKNIGLFSLTLFFICTILSAAHKDDIHPMFEIDETEKSHNLITSPPKEYWLLSLDGGGERGILHLKTLAELEKRTGKRIVDMFDGIAGTSIGGIIATLLTAPHPNDPSKPRYTPQELLDIFFAKRFVMFQPKWFSFNGLLRTKYKTSGMKQFLFYMLGHNTFKNRWIPTILATHDLNTYNMRLFSSIDDDDYFAKDIAMATAAAPTYYKPQHIFPIDNPTSTSYFVSDGGTCMSTPTQAGIAMLIKHYDAKFDEIHVLSLGTGISTTPFCSKSLLRGGIVHWISVLVDLLIHGQQNTDVNIARFFFGNRYHRFNPILKPDLITFDNLSDANGAAVLKANEKMLEERNEEFSQIANTLSKLAENKQKRTIHDLSGPTILQTSPLQNFLFWLIGWNRFQSDAQLILRQSQTKPTNF